MHKISNRAKKDHVLEVQKDIHKKEPVAPEKKMFGKFFVDLLVSVKQYAASVFNQFITHANKNVIERQVAKDSKSTISNPVIKTGDVEAWETEAKHFEKAEHTFLIGYDIAKDTGNVQVMLNYALNESRSGDPMLRFFGVIELSNMLKQAKHLEGSNPISDYILANKEAILSAIERRKNDALPLVRDTVTQILDELRTLGI